MVQAVGSCREVLVMLPRTERQAEVLRFIQTYAAKRGAQPSYGQIARHLGVKSRATVAKHIAALERRGLVAREGDNRNFKLKFTTQSVTCPNCNHAFMHSYIAE